MSTFEFWIMIMNCASYDISLIFLLDWTSWGLWVSLNLDILRFLTSFLFVDLVFRVRILSGCSFLGLLCLGFQAFCAWAI